MTEQVPAEAWHGDVIGPLVPQLRNVVRRCDYWRKIDSRNNLVIIYASIEYSINYSAQLAITAINLLIIYVAYAAFNMISLTIILCCY